MLIKGANVIETDWDFSPLKKNSTRQKSNEERTLNLSPEDLVLFVFLFNHGLIFLKNYFPTYIIPFNLWLIDSLG